jgi:hypothetical protein
VNRPQPGTEGAKSTKDLLCLLRLVAAIRGASMVQAHQLQNLLGLKWSPVALMLVLSIG